MDYGRFRSKTIKAWSPKICTDQSSRRIELFWTSTKWLSKRIRELWIVRPRGNAGQYWFVFQGWKEGSAAICRTYQSSNCDPLSGSINDPGDSNRDEFNKSYLRERSKFDCVQRNNYLEFNTPRINAYHSSLEAAGQQLCKLLPRKIEGCFCWKISNTSRAKISKSARKLKRKKIEKIFRLE